MAAKVDIRDPYSCSEAMKWDAMTVESFMRQSVSYEVYYNLAEFVALSNNYNRFFKIKISTGDY